jgi:hypothetical protein
MDMQMQKTAFFSVYNNLQSNFLRTSQIFKVSLSTNKSHNSQLQSQNDKEHEYLFTNQFFIYLTKIIQLWMLHNARLNGNMIMKGECIRFCTGKARYVWKY